MNLEFVTPLDRGGVRFYTGVGRVCRLDAKRGTNKSYLARNAWELSEWHCSQIDETFLRRWLFLTPFTVLRGDTTKK